MSRLQTALVIALTAAVAVGMAIPAGAAVGPTSSTEQVDDQPPGQTVSAAVGQQLSTVLSLTGAEIRSEAADAGFEQRFNQSNATERGEAVADRAVVLSERATELRTEYETLTEAIQAGEIDGVTYAQEVASLAATASTVETSLDRLAERAATLPAAERRALNVTDADLAAISAELGPLSGQTAAAILSQFTGTVGGEIEIGTDNGLEIEVENEDGERSTQLERPRDGDGSYELNQSAALANAKAALSEPSTGAWVLTSSSADDGAYEFEFDFTGPGEGEAEVAVDGQTGTVFELEESIEAGDDDDDDDEDDDERLAIELIEGEPAPGANVTLLVTDGGQPVSGASVELEEAVVGTTGPDGIISLTLPADEADIEVTDGDREGELEFEFADDEEDVSLGATADIENGTVTVSVVLGDEPIEGALVTANDAVVGTTGPDGTVSFPLPDGDELDIEIEHGDGEAELEYEFDDEEEQEEREDDENDENDEEEEEEREDDENDEEEEEEREDDENDEEEEEEREDDDDEEDDPEDGGDDE